MRFPALESVQNAAIDKLAVAAKHWGAPITWIVCAEWTRTQNYHSKISLTSCRKSGCLWALGAEPWECRTASLWDESSAPSPVLSRARSSNPLWICLFPCSWQPCALFCPAQHFGRRSPPQLCRRQLPDTRAGKYRQRERMGSGNRRKHVKHCPLLFSLLRIE